MNYQSNKNNITKSLFIIYLFALFEIIVFKMEVPFTNMGYLRNVNLIPFKESLLVNGKIDFSEIIMNGVIFIPLGIYLEMIFSKWSVIKKVLAIIFISLVCEILQYIMAIGASDITDIINNTIGGAIGLLSMNMLTKIFKDKAKIYKIVNIIATIGTISMILLLTVIVIANL